MPKKKHRYYLIFTIIILSFLGNFRTYMVMGESDLPTFENGDKVIINRSAYDMTLPFSSKKIFPWRNPSRGDMVLCYLKKRNNQEFWLKRIIGLPGDTLRIRKNKIFINGKQFKYEILKKESVITSYPNALGEIVAIESGLGINHLVTYSENESIISDYGPHIISENQYFVLGDNRFNSLDSRFLGLVPRQNIFGKYLFRIYRKN